MTNKINNKVKRILNQYSSDNGCISIVDIFNHTIDDAINGKFIDDVISYCDDNCSNGYFSRWTNFGVDLVNDAISFTDRVIDLQKS